MATLYCPECGYKNEYSIHPPKFCGGCGAPLSGDKKRNEKKTKSSSSSIKRKPLEEDETDVEFIPELSDLDVSISYESSPGRSFKSVRDLPSD